MQKLLIFSGNADKPAYLKHYLRSFPGHVPDAVEQHLKDKNIPLSGLSLAQLHGFIMETWQEDKANICGFFIYVNKEGGF